MISTVPFFALPLALSLSLFVDAQVGDGEGGSTWELFICTHVSHLAFMNQVSGFERAATWRVEEERRDGGEVVHVGLLFRT